MARKSATSYWRVGAEQAYHKAKNNDYALASTEFQKPTGR
jgi:hypothetical protein